MQPNLECPNCCVQISRAMQRKMSPIWSALRPTACEGCTELIQWHSSLHKKMTLGSTVFRIGTAIMVLSIIPYLLGKTNVWLFFLAMGFVVGLFGVFTTASQLQNVKVELVDEFNAKV